MKALTCELCGGNQLVKKDGMFVCEHCGTKYTAEEARKLFVTVTVDHTEETDKLLTLARRARQEDNIEDAHRYYELVLRDRPNDWEAAFYEAYFGVRNVQVSMIYQGAEEITAMLSSVLPLVKNHVPPHEHRVTLSEIVGRVQSLADDFMSVANNKYANYLNVPKRRGEYILHTQAVGTLYTTLFNNLRQYFPEEKELAQTVCHSALQHLKTARITSADLRESINYIKGQLSSLDPTYKPGGCYVATCVYGSYDCPPVWTLRRFRDQILAATAPGRAFIRAYYAVSPALVRRFGRARWFRALTKRPLDALVRRLRRQGVADTPYADR